MILTHRKFGDDIYARFLVIMKNVVISFIKEYRRPTLRLPCDVIDDLIIMKKAFLGIIWNDLFISEVKLKLCPIIKNFKMAALLSSRQTFLPEVIPEVEYTRKIAVSIPTFWAFDRRSSSNIKGDVSISKFDLLCDLVTSSMTSWVCKNITCTTRHPQQCTCKILFVWHLSFIVKSSGQTSWQT